MVHDEVYVDGQLSQGEFLIEIGWTSSVSSDALTGNLNTNFDTVFNNFESGNQVTIILSVKYEHLQLVSVTT